MDQYRLDPTKENIIFLPLDTNLSIDKKEISNA